MIALADHEIGHLQLARTGCRADGIDINPYMIRIGQHCTEFLQLQGRVKLVAQPFQDYRPAQVYTVVLSFATHWTDDRNYRVRLQDHLLRIHGMMANGGLLVFESHSADVGNAEFYAALEEMRGERVAQRMAAHRLHDPGRRRRALHRAPERPPGFWGRTAELEIPVMSTAKEELTRLIQGQPEDSSREEIVRELAFHVMVERGIADSDAKRTISNEEMGRRIRSWQR